MDFIGLIVLALTLGHFEQRLPDHPVPLPTDFDPAKCVECHEDRQQGKYVHTAISIGCTACHKIELTEGITRIGLISPVGELCTTCHQQTTEGTLHAPYQQKQCVVCHDPHASDYIAHTRAPVNALCLGCHAPRTAERVTIDLLGSQTLIAEAFNQGPKIVLDRSQRTGHPFLEHPVAGTPDPFRKGQDMSCLSCHLPHADALPKLLPESWKAIEVCDQCHEAAKAGKEKSKEKGRL